MNVISLRIIVSDIERIIAFYEKITEIAVTRYTPDFVELKTSNAALAIGSTKTLDFFGGEAVAQPGQNHSAIIEFRVQDVDKDYERLSHYLDEYIVQKPTVMPWGNKSLLFRDPEGNLVNFFTPVSQQAMTKFNSNE